MQSVAMEPLHRLITESKVELLKDGMQTFLETSLMDDPPHIRAVMLLTGLIKSWIGGQLCLWLRSPLLSVFNRITATAQHLWRIKQHQATLFLWQVRLLSSYILHVWIIAEPFSLPGFARPSTKILIVLL